MSARSIELLFKVVSRSLFRTDSSLGYARTLTAFDRLCDEVMSTETDEGTWSLGECEDCDLGSLIAGAYWWMCDNHGGQNSPEYATQCNLGRIFSPGMSELDADSSEQTAYDALDALKQGLTSF